MAVSYAIAAAAALLSALAYAEFMVDLPFAGGAFNCILLTFGELPGWCAAHGNLLLLLQPAHVSHLGACARGASHASSSSTYAPI